MIQTENDILRQNEKESEVKRDGILMHPEISGTLLM